MKIHLLSDVHLDFANMGWENGPPESDVVVLAGDIGQGKRAFPWIERWWHDTPVIYVAGNHEFYGRRVLTDHYKALNDKAKASPNVFFLQNEALLVSIDRIGSDKLENVTFVGATLWTDYNLYGKAGIYMDAAEEGINDYRQIMDNANGARITAARLLQHHKESVSYIRTNLSEKLADDKTVVVTHHAPSERSIAPHFVGDKLNPAFASDLEYLMKRYAPNLWVHGHTHNSFDYMVDSTRVVCNPRGYVNYEENPNFNPDLIIEI
jgi:predicted phosphodiesterase